MELSRLVEIIELEFPPITAWSDDSIGLQISNSKSRIKNVFLTLELNESIIEEAISNDSDLIIAFHPLIFRPISAVNTNNRVGNLLTKLIKNDIALYVIHTNFDSHPNGTSHELSLQLGFKKVDFLVEDKNLEGYGMGAIIDLDEPINTEDLLRKISKLCNSPLRYNKGSKSLIKRIAILGGSGSGYISEALNKNCDALITADMKYHDFHSVEGKMIVIDPGHYEMEQFVPKAMKRILDKKIGNEINFVTGRELTNPVLYFPENDYIDLQKKYLNKL